MPATKRGTDPSGNQQFATRPLWCWLCEPGKRTLVGRYRPDRLNTAAHAHIDHKHAQGGTRHDND